MLRTILLPLVVGFAGGSAIAADPPATGDFTTELNGLKLWYKVAGTGPVCLFPTPGWGPSSDMYFRTMKSMEKSFTVVYLDSRGTGKSDRAKELTEYTWDHFVADLDALRGHLKQDRVWVMGHSEGGMQALHYAVKHPDRVNGLVLLDTSATVNLAQSVDVASRADRRKGKPWYSAAKDAQKSRPKTDEELAGMLKAMMPFYWSDPAKFEPYKEDFAATTFSAVAMQGQSASKRMPFDLTKDLPKIKAPTLIVVGDDDFCCSPVWAHQLHLGLSNSKLLVIEKCGHFPWLEQPTVFEDRVPKFLAALGVPTRSEPK